MLSLVGLLLLVVRVVTGFSLELVKDRVCASRGAVEAVLTGLRAMRLRFTYKELGEAGREGASATVMGVFGGRPLLLVVAVVSFRPINRVFCSVRSDKEEVEGRTKVLFGSSG